MPSPVRRLGIFGGTFDPPHRGHRIVVGSVADALSLDRVLWIPAARSPHKLDTPLSRGSVREAMARAACADDPRFSVSSVELERAGPSYTIDTLRLLADDPVDGGAELFLIVGVDQYRAFDDWRDPEEILERATLVVMDRRGERAASVESRVGSLQPGRIHRIAVPRVDVSSTEVRDRVSRGTDVTDLVGTGVAAIIDVEGLYRV